MQSVIVDGPDDVPLDDGESMPSAFLAAPLIDGGNVDVGFTQTYAYAVANMRHYSSHGRTHLTLTLKRGETVVDSDTASSLNEELLPRWNTMVTRVVLSTPAPCGYRADARAVFSAWMAFPIPRTGTLFSWGHVQQPFPGTASQPACPPPPGGSGGDEEDDYYFINTGNGENEDGGEVYDGSCETCQLWLAFVNGVYVTYWWECTEVDPEYCESLDEVR
jgi:hypothetical protein